MFVQCAGLHGSYSDLSGRSPSGSDSVRSRPRRSTCYPSTFIAIVAEFAVSALSTYKFKFSPSAPSCLLRPLLTSLSTSLRLATSVAHDGHQQGSPQVSHMRFTSYPSDLRDAFPFQHRVNQFWPSLPVVPPQIRFLYVELTLCYQLPSSVCYLPDCAESLDLPLTADFQHVRCLHTNENPVDEKPPTGLRIRDPDQMLLTAPSPAPHPS